MTPDLDPAPMLAITARQWSHERAKLGLEIMRGYRAGDGPSPTRRRGRARGTRLGRAGGRPLPAPEHGPLLSLG